MSKQQQWMRNRAGGPLHQADISCESNECWPVAVIDPEDREQAEGFAKRQQDLYHAAGGSSMSWEDLTAYQRDAVIEATTSAFREFANPKPPKPEEPQGLGAVVEDADGVRWVRAGDSHGGRLSDNWRRVTAHGDDGWWSEWRNINAVTVLSEGVQS